MECYGRCEVILVTYSPTPESYRVRVLHVHKSMTELVKGLSLEIRIYLLARKKQMPKFECFNNYFEITLLNYIRRHWNLYV